MSTRRKTVPADNALRVGFITPGLGMGGAERWLLSLTRHFSRKAVKVTGILTGSTTGALAAEARKLCPVYLPEEAGTFAGRCDTVIAWGWNHLREFREIYKGRLIAVSHGTPGNFWGDQVSARMAEAEGVEMVGVSYHSLDVWPGRGTGIYFPNGAELDRCTPRRGRDWMRAHIGITAGQKVALFCARFSGEKRPWAMLSMVPFLPDNWHVVMCGPDLCGWGGSIGTPPPRVHILPPQEHVGDVLAAADVFVLPSEMEAHPIALSEAWLAGVPAVYSEWPFVSQLRADHQEELGVAVPLYGSPQELAAAVLQADIFREDLIHRARRIAWQHYTASAMAARWEQYLSAPRPLSYNTYSSGALGSAEQFTPIPLCQN